jgi:hypothetical protein
MSTPVSGVPEKLAALLETLPAEDRQAITTWLLHRTSPVVPTAIGFAWPHVSPPSIISRITSAPTSEEERLRRLAGTLPAGEDNQLITIRLPAERHAELRSWCASHGFTMAAVVRGLVERFLEDQAR